MVYTIVSRCVKRTLQTLGIELRRVPRGHPHPRNSLLGALYHVQRLGWKPLVCLDVGAAFGDFSLTCSRIYPDACYMLIEPLEEYRPFLTAAVSRLPKAKYSPSAACASDGSIVIHVHKDLVGSSLYRETEGPQVDGTERTVPAIRLDTLCREHNLKGPYLLKIDVQGAELEVLAGATKVLQESEYVILEISFFRFFLEGPDFHEVVNFMKDRGFVVYDIWGLKYRPLDGTLAQLDVAFVREDGLFRKHHLYATPEQRAEQDTKFQKLFSDRLWRLKKQRV